MTRGKGGGGGSCIIKKGMVWVARGGTPQECEA